MKVVLIGLGRRCQNVYLPAVRALELELHGVCGRTLERTREKAAAWGVRAYESLDQVLEDPAVDLLVVAVPWNQNTTVYQRIAESSKPALLETPLAPRFSDAAAIAARLSARAVPTAIGEQYHQRPIEILKQRLIAEGVFGEITYAFTDGVGHETHAISIIRSYLGREQRLDRVAAMQQRAPVASHALNRQRLYPWEQSQHALLMFRSRAQAMYHWSWLAYDSPLRPHRIAGFHGSLGGAWGEECIRLEDPEAPPQHLRIERRSRSVDGVDVPYEYVAFSGTRFLAKWSNPYPNLVLSEELIVAASLLGNLVAAIRGEDAPLYSPSMALEDHRIVAAIRRAIELGQWQSEVTVEPPSAEALPVGAQGAANRSASPGGQRPHDSDG
jgi:predicted dehydrogenase